MRRIPYRLLAILIVALATVTLLALREAENSNTAEAPLRIGKGLGSPQVNALLESFQNAPVSTEALPTTTADAVDAISIRVPEALWSEAQNKERMNYFKETQHRCEISLGQGYQSGTWSLRGRGSLRRAYGESRPLRLSFELQADQPLSLTQTWRARTIYALAMTYDEHAFELAFCYGVLRELGLFPSRTRMVRLELNGSDLGLYLLVEPPVDAIKRFAASQWPDAELRRIYRRTGDHDPLRMIFSCKYARDRRPPDGPLSELTPVLDSQRTLSERAQLLEEAVGLDRYFYWLAFNALVQNGDQLDELFLYQLGNDDHTFPFYLAAWDYDDLMGGGNTTVSPLVDDPLLYGSMSPLDSVIVNHPPLRERYVSAVRRLLGTRLTEAYLTDQLESVRVRGEALLDQDKIGSRREAISQFGKQLLVNRRHLMTER